MSESIVLGNGEVDDHPMGKPWGVAVMMLGTGATMFASAYLIGEKHVSLYLGFVLFYVGMLGLLGLVFAIDEIRKLLQPIPEPIAT